MKKLLIISIAIIMSWKFIGVVNAMNTDDIASKYDYYKVRYQISCGKYDSTDARCFWKKVELVFAKEVLQKIDINEYLTEDELTMITKKIGFLKSRYTNFCENTDSPAKFCSALDKLVYKSEYFLENAQKLASDVISCSSEIDDDLIDQISNMVIEINQRKYYHESRKPLTDESTEGGEMIAYFNGGNLHKIETSYFGEMGNKIYTYYFEPKKGVKFQWSVIYVDIKETSYDMPMYMEGFKETGTTENTFYFKNDHLIKWDQASKTDINKCGGEYKEWESDIIEEVLRLIELAFPSKPPF